MLERRKRLVLHVGLHKTGSTSIQTLLRNNNEALKSVGVMYPGPDIDPRLANGASHRAFLCALTANYQKLSAMANLAECRASLAKTVDFFRTDEKLHTLLISHEALGRRSQALDRSITDVWAKEFDLSVVLYVRPLREWIESYYVQLLWGRSKRGGPAAAVPLSKTLPKTIGESLPSAIYDGFRKALPSANIDVRSFSLRRQNDDLIKNFVETTIPEFAPILATMKEEKHKNPSKLSCNMMFLFYVLRGGAKLQTVKAVRRALIKAPKENKTEPPLADRSYYFVSDEDFAKLEEIDSAEAKRFPDLALDAPVKRRPDAAFRLTESEYGEMLEWLRPRIPPSAYQDAAKSYKS